MKQSPPSPRVILGIADSFTASAAILVDNELIAAVSEERLSRVKMAYGWPRTAIGEVLRIAGLEPKDVDAIAVASTTQVWRPKAETIPGYFDADWGLRKNVTLAMGALGAQLVGRFKPAQVVYRALKRAATGNRLREIPRVLREQHGLDAPIHYIDHHLAHAASAYYFGGQIDATIFTLDGGGDGLSGSVYRGERGRLHKEGTVSSYDSVGNWYSYVTHVLGFKAHRHEGKITGLAANGEPLYADRFRACITHRNGDLANTGRAFHRSAVRKVRRILPSGARREDVAASIQGVLEEVCTGFASHWLDRLPARHVGLAGGVFANVKLNQRVHALSGCDSVFVFPGMGDEGLAPGAALQLAAERAQDDSIRMRLVSRIPDVYLGPTYGADRMRRALEDADIAYERPDNLARAVSELLARKRVVARYGGRMEFGPRALGNRSILCHAGDATVNDWLNARLQRTEFMPFAPVTLEEDWRDCYVGLEGAEHAARFMTITCNCTHQLEQTCPAVVHVDGTARPQLVTSDGDPLYRQILEEYKARTGYSTIINTSFNMHEEPIVCTPEDAVRAFLKGHLDALAIGEFLAEPESRELNGTEARKADRE